ncbi:rhamnulokinase family protein [Deinococcus sp. QL22]|uniref:rhamnulokinase n=1 Tax=Deinococcus sp. QL22 TaxID=2939437 RepID=UPI002016EEBD|nr:rhamnulokinase family protein [Deinococcus sp. QL22]UQN08382.1 rhamnulokinase [Deinococcus sp. QL22]
MSAERVWHAAVDLGASGGRVAIGGIHEGRLEIEVLHRFSNNPVMVPFGTQPRLYWDVLGLWAEILKGLKRAGERAGELGGRVASVGVDSWAVDYALLDSNGLLLDGVHHYRSARTDGVMAEVLQEHSRDELFALTGLQFLPFNTLYQWLALRRDTPGVLDQAHTFLMVPDLMNFWLSGRMVCERSNASTTQFYHPALRTWSYPLLERLGLPVALLPGIVEAGSDLGPLLPPVAEATGLSGVRVIVPATHDTASAVVATPLSGPEAAFLSSGTWSLLGVETDAPILSPAALQANFTNEAGIDGTTRLLKNVMGLWIMQQCRLAWPNASFADLNVAAEAAPPFLALIDVDDPRFLLPGDDMPERIQQVCRETGQGVPGTRGEIARVVFESLALKYARVLAELEEVAGRALEVIHIVGGGSLAGPLCQWTADATGRQVQAGPVDATLIGNLLVQAQACGVLPQGERRAVVARTFAFHTFLPQHPEAWQDAQSRFAALYGAGMLA